MDHNKAASGGLPWLDHPVRLHSSRADTCKLTAAQCAYRSGFWVYWYEADHRYGLTTVYFLLACIGLFVIANVWSRLPHPKASALSRLEAVFKYAAYKQYRLPGWQTPPLGVILLVGAGIVFFAGLTLGPKPYYWPNTRKLSYGNSPPIATRTGWMALGLTPFVVALAAKANLISAITGISHEKLQVFHHWTSYAMFILALIHTFPFIIFHIWKGDMQMVYKTSVVYWTGIVALIFQTYLTVMSWGPIRNRFYEFFKATHYLCAFLFLFFFFIHCDFRLSSWDYFIATGTIYLASLLYSQLRTYFAYGFSYRAYLYLLPSGILQVKVPVHPSAVAKAALPFDIKWTPGQHMFVRFLSLDLHCLSSHPFSICSLPSQNPEKGDSELVFYITPVKGYTARLAKMAEKQPGRRLRVLLEGPYGGLCPSSFARFESVVVIAGGSGAGFSLPLVEDILRRARYQDKEKAKKELPSVPFKTKSLQIIIATRNHKVVEWYQKEIERLLTAAGVDQINIGVAIHCTLVNSKNEKINEEDQVTRLESTLEGKVADVDEENKLDGSQETLSQSQDRGTNHNVVIHQGRPQLADIIENITSDQNNRNKSVGIAVCGPRSMLFDVRNAAAAAQTQRLKGSHEGEVYLHSEHFGW